MISLFRQNRVFVSFLVSAAVIFCAAASAQTASAPAAASSAPEASAPLVTSIKPDGKPHKFEARDHQFFIDGQPTLIVAGEMHFGRMLPEDFETRVKQAKAMGLNALSFYLFWNQVEKKEGQFDFTGMNDVRRMLKICQDNGLWVILRPGPYCCAEVEYGGIPYWVAKYPEVPIRTHHEKYVEWSRKYIEQVYKQVGDLQVGKGGPLIMVQMENEFGNARPRDNYYMEALHKIFLDVGFEVPLFICDPFPTRQGFLMPGVLAEQNGLRGPASPALLSSLGDFPVYVPEVYTAWFLGWGAAPSGSYRSRSPLAANMGWLNILLDNKYSFCLYMFFGGTNYGFYNGCLEFLPIQTSYDYAAPVDEAGRTTEKYRAMRDLLAKRLNLTLPDPPPEPSVIEIPAFKLTQKEPLLSTLPDKPSLVAAKTVSMEDLDQDYGFVLYRKKFPNGVKGTLELKQAMDYSIVMANGKVVGRAFIGEGLDTNKIALNETGPVTLDILVYNLGRVSVITNDRTQWRARKGLIQGASLDGVDLADWEMYSLPYANGVANFKASDAVPTGPTFYRGTFNVDKLGSSFLDMRNWGFGAVWVNGHNLGRFWDRGAQRALFVPQAWLKQGANDIVVLELNDAPKAPEISGVTNMITEAVVPFPVRLDTATPVPAAN